MQCLELQQSQREIPRTTTDVKQSLGIGRGCHRGLSNPMQRNRCVHGRRLAGFEIRESLNVCIESLPDFFNRRFHEVRLCDFERKWR